MNAMRIVKPPRPVASKKTAPVKAAGYLEFIRTLPCLVTLSPHVQAAHLSKHNTAYGHFGRGKGRKASDRWALPLSTEAHRQQHDMGDEMKFWRMYSINPYIAALTLHGLWGDLGVGATEIANDLIYTQQIGRV